MAKISRIFYGILFDSGAKNALDFHQKFVLNLPLPVLPPLNNENSDEHLLLLPYFVTFYPNQESETLGKQYEKDRKKVLKMYSKGDFLEITLSKLLSKVRFPLKHLLNPFYNKNNSNN